MTSSSMLSLRQSVRMASHLPLRDTTPPATTMAIHIAAFPSPALTGDVVSPILVTTASFLMVIGLSTEATAPSSLADAPSARPVFKPLCLSLATMLPPCFILAAGHGPHPGRVALSALAEFHVLPPPLCSVLHNLIYDGHSHPV